MKSGDGKSTMSQSSPALSMRVLALSLNTAEEPKPFRFMDLAGGNKI